jgi:phage tail protein X
MPPNISLPPSTSLSLNTSLGVSARTRQGSIRAKPVPVRAARSAQLRIAALPIAQPDVRSAMGPPPRLPNAAIALVAASVRGISEAHQAESAAESYAAAHLAALRAAAAVIAVHGRTSRSSRVRSVWVLLSEAAPGLAAWSQFYAAGANKRMAAQAGLAHLVTATEAGNLLQASEEFLGVVSAMLGIPVSLPDPVPAKRAG